MRLRAVGWGIFLAKASKVDVNGVLEAARRLGRQVSPAVVEHEVAERGYVPVFVDSTKIEVGCELFEGRAQLGHRADAAAALRVRRQALGFGPPASGRRPCGTRLAEADGVGFAPLLPKGTPI